MRVTSEKAFHAYGIQMRAVTEFKYLSWGPQTNGGPRMYKMHFPAKYGRRRCPVEGCPGC